MLELNKIYLGNNLDLLKQLPDNSVDSVVTDPPYGINFMGKKWDYDVPSVELWREVYRVLKPGGHALVACGTRTQHRMAVNIEDGGFEIRDIVGWIYGYVTKRKPCIYSWDLATSDSNWEWKKMFTVVKMFTDDEDSIINGTVPFRFWYDEHNNSKKDIYFLLVEKLEIFDTPKQLKEFSVEEYAMDGKGGWMPCNQPLIHAPRSWQYVEVGK